MKFALAASALALATSASAAATSPVRMTFVGVSGLKGEIHANGGILWTNKETKTVACPSSGVDCSGLTDKDTTFLLGDNGRISLNVVDTGGQQVYIGPHGTLKFTEGHDGAVEAGSKVKAVKAILLQKRTWICYKTTESGVKDRFLQVAKDDTVNPYYMQQLEKHATKLGGGCEKITIKFRPAPKAKPAFRFA